ARVASLDAGTPHMLDDALDAHATALCMPVLAAATRHRLHSTATGPIAIKGAPHRPPGRHRRTPITTASAAYKRGQGAPRCLHIRARLPKLPFLALQRRRTELQRPPPHLTHPSSVSRSGGRREGHLCP